MNKNGSRFWADLAKRTGTWSGATALGAFLLEYAEPLFEEGAETLLGWKHFVAVVGVAVVRAVLGLIQGKVGDPDKASFSAAPSADTADGEKGD